MSIKGFFNSLKDSLNEYVTLQPLGSNKYGIDSVMNAMGEIANDVVESSLIDLDNANRTTITATAHSAQVGDQIKITSGTDIYKSAAVLEVTANTITVGLPMSGLAPADTFKILRGVNLQVDPDTGGLSTTATPIRFQLNGVSQVVTEDTVTPSNNAPLPVKLTSVTGDVNITAGDLNVQLSDVGPSYDSVRIGNGTNLLAINASLEAQVRDDDANTSLAAILAKIIAAPATEAKQDSAITELQAILAKIIAAPSTEAKQDTIITGLTNLLTELQLKADLTETQPVSLAAVPLPTGAATEATLASVLAKIIAAPSTEAKQDTVITALANLLTELQLKADLSETQPVSLAAVPLPTGAATEATLASVLAKIIAAPATEAKQDSTITALGNLLAELQLKADLSETQPVSAASLPLPTGAATEATLLAQSAKLPASVGSKISAESLSVTFASDQTSAPSDALDVVGFTRIDFSVDNVTTGAYTELFSTVGATEVRKMMIFLASGTPMFLATGAAAAEVDKFIIYSGMDAIIEVTIPAGTRLSLKSIGSNITSGQMIINLMG